MAELKCASYVGALNDLQVFPRFPHGRFFFWRMLALAPQKLELTIKLRLLFLGAPTLRQSRWGFFSLSRKFTRQGPPHAR